MHQTICVLLQAMSDAPCNSLPITSDLAQRIRMNVINGLTARQNRGHQNFIARLLSIHRRLLYLHSFWILCLMMSIQLCEPFNTFRFVPYLLRLSMMCRSWMPMDLHVRTMALAFCDWKISSNTIVNLRVRLSKTRSSNSFFCVRLRTAKGKSRRGLFTGIESMIN